LVSSLVPAVALICVLGALSAYTFGLYGRLIHASQAKTMGDVWGKIKGKSSAWIISFATLTFCYGGALVYTIMLGDTFSALAGSAGLTTGFATSRSFWILFLSVAVLNPLCNLSSLAKLAPISIMGVIGVLATTCFMGWRCPSLNVASPYNILAANSATVAGSSKVFLSTLLPHQLPSFGTFSKSLASPATLILAGMAATSYLGHFSAAEFYHALKPTEPTTDSKLSLRDYFKMTLGGFGSVTLINCLVMAFGFLTFGGNSKGLILNNFSTIDLGASICRLLMAICVIGGYPFILSACRSETVELIRLFKPSVFASTTEAKLKQTITRFFLVTLAGLALVVKNAGFVIGFIGAVMGSAMIYIFPSMLFLKHTSLSNTGSSTSTPFPRSVKLERLFCRFLIGFGVVATVAGGGGCILDTFFPHLL
jgi:solute carrier family 38 (sodium-coupled neutral amino acid transporter), member 11